MGMARYDTRRIYDAPDILLTQALQGETTWRTVMNTFTRPNSLSIEERDSFADELKDALGNHSVTNAMVDVMKNPFFWLLFVTSPVAQSSLRAGKNIIFNRAAMLGAYMKKNPDALGRYQLLTGTQYFSGAPGVGAAIGDVSRMIDRAQRRVAEWMTTPHHDFLMEHGLTRGINPAYYSDPKKKEVIEKLRMGMQGALTRVHEGGTYRVAEAQEALGVYKFTPEQGIPPVAQLKSKDMLTGTRAAEAREVYNKALEANQRPPFYILEVPLESGQIPIKIAERQVAGWGGRDPFEVLEEIKAMPLFHVYDKMRKTYLIENWLKPLARGTPQHARDFEGTLLQRADQIIDDVEYVVDPDKVIRMFRANKNPILTKAPRPKGEEMDPPAARGMQLITSMMSKPVQEALWVSMVQEAEGLVPAGLQLKQFYNMVRQIIAETLDVSRYVPRNVIEVLGRGGVRMSPADVMSLRLGPTIFATQRSVPRAAFDVFWHPDDMKLYKELMGADSPAFNALLASNEAKLAGRIGEHGIGHAVVQRINPSLAFERYAKDMNETNALFIAPLSEEAHIAQQTWKQLPQDKVNVASHTGTLGHTKGAPVGQPFREVEAEMAALGRGALESQVPAGGFNYADMFWSEYNLLGNERARNMLMDVLLPTTTGRLTSANITGMAVGHLQRDAAKWMSQTKWFMDALEKNGGDWGKNVAKVLRDTAETPASELLNSRSIANLLYVTHLGANLSSVLLNSFQPLLLGGPMVGADNLLHGYGRAFQELGQYWKARKKLPVRLSDVQKEKLIRDNFKWANVNGEDLLDIHPSIHHTIDAVGAGELGITPPSWIKYLTMDAPMKLFEKAEWLNRLVMSHATERMLSRANPGMAPELVARNVRDMVRETQYGAHVMNTPLAMLPHKPPSGGTQSEWFFSDPTMRQFMMFPVRTATAFAYTPRLMAAPGVKERWPLLMANLRAFAYGGVTYDVLKNTGGFDMSRGLYPYAALDFFEGERFIEGKEGVSPIMIPPVIDIGAGFISWVMGGEDNELLRRWLPRVLPGGVGVTRALSLIPSPDQDWPLGRLARDLQGFYVGWGEPRFDGRVPVYKSDGTLVSYQKPTTMILRGLGMDMRKFSSEAEIDRWLANNRDAAATLKREFMTAILNQDWSHADRLNERHQKKFGIPIRLTRQQLSSQMRTRTLTRTERLLDRMSPDLRERYIQAIQHKAPQLGLTPEQLGHSTATRRTQAGAQRPAPLSPEAQKYLEAYMAEDPGGVFRRFGSNE
jgi:hypothetical protein